MRQTSESLRLIALVWVAVGTVGLLVNEFIVHLGRTATLASAALNLIGLIVLGATLMRDRKRSAT